MVDIFSRKITSWEVFLAESAYNSRTVLERAVLAERIIDQPLVLHADNGSPSVVVKESVASEVIQATCFSGSATVTWSSRSGLSDTVPIGVQLRVLPLHRAGLASRAA